MQAVAGKGMWCMGRGVLRRSGGLRYQRPGHGQTRRSPPPPEVIMADKREEKREGANIWTLEKQLALTWATLGHGSCFLTVAQVRGRSGQ